MELEHNKGAIMYTDGGEQKQGEIDKIIAKTPHQVCPNFYPRFKGLEKQTCLEVNNGRHSVRLHWQITEKSVIH